jgi:hypothetical protein
MWLLRKGNETLVLKHAARALSVMWERRSVMMIKGDRLLDANSTYEMRLPPIVEDKTDFSVVVWLHPFEAIRDFPCTIFCKGSRATMQLTPTLLLDEHNRLVLYVSTRTNWAERFECPVAIPARQYTQVAVLFGRSIYNPPK